MNLTPLVNDLREYIESKDCKSHDPFDGLTSPLVKVFPRSKYFRIFWIQFFKKFPINLRVFIGIKEDLYPKIMGDLAAAYLMLADLNEDENFQKKAINCLAWLEANSCKDYSGYCWGLGFDYQNRTVYVNKSLPNLVNTYYCANAFLDAFRFFKEPRYYFILKDLGFEEANHSVCLNYYPGQKSYIHNANMLGAALLSRVYKHTADEELLKIAHRAVQYTIKCQLENGSWYYGEKKSLRWIDNFHTGYVLEALHNYMQYTGSNEFLPRLLKGIQYYKAHLFLSDGTPKYFHNKVYPVDVQCAAQAIQTLAVLSSLGTENLKFAKLVSEWTFVNMLDKKGYFYYRKNKYFKNKIPYIRWGQTSMLVALAHLMRAMNSTNEEILLQQG